MKLNKQTSKAFTFLMIAMLNSIAAHAETAFTYQGQLSQSGQAAQGQYDMTFAMYDADSAGNQVGVTLSETGIDVTDGVFAVLLDFGDAPFISAPRWLEIAVRETGGGAYTILSPRQRVGASPFAIETLFVAPGAVDTAALQNGAVTEVKLAEQAVTLGKIDNGAVVSGSIANGEVKTVDIDTGAVTQAKIADDAVDTAALQNGAVTEEKIAEQAVTLGKIDNGAVISGSIANGEVKTVDIDTGAVTRAKIANDAVASEKIENGSILPEDIDGNVYNRKGSVYVNSNSVPVSFGINRLTVTCTGAKDLLINHVCNVPTENSDITVLSERLTSMDNDVNPAQLTCTAENRDPPNAETLTATVWCLAVD